jgi:hypothetical protein
MVVPGLKASYGDPSLWEIMQQSVFDTGLGNGISIDKIGGSPRAEAVRRPVVAPLVRYGCDGD